jgi:hypothetical protein
MFNRITRVLLRFKRQQATQSGAATMVVRNTTNGFIATAHHALMVVGISAIATLTVLFFKPHLADQIKQLSPFSIPAVAEPDFAELQQIGLPDAPGKSEEPVAANGDDASKLELELEQAKLPLTAEEKTIIATAAEQKRITAWLAKRYRVASGATDMLVSAAYLNAKEIKLDPLLILAVMAIESRFNPFAESSVGAQGLMQVMSKVHHEKFQELGGIQAALNPAANIKVGSLILKEYVRRGGSVEAGLKMYVGAALSETDSGYGAKVLAEFHRLQQVAAGKSVPAFATAAAKPVQKPVEQDEQKTDALTEANSAVGRLAYN